MHISCNINIAVNFLFDLSTQLIPFLNAAHVQIVQHKLVEKYSELVLKMEIVFPF